MENETMLEGRQPILRIQVVRPSRAHFRRLALEARRWYPTASEAELGFYLRGCCDAARYRYTASDIQRALDGAQGEG